MRNLYLIANLPEIIPDWDCYDAHLVAADNTLEAREIASNKAADEGKNHWLDETITSIEFIGITSKDKGIIISSFNAG